jgi:molybdopterin/thiamine biosynthesis adenylyltransferase
MGEPFRPRLKPTMPVFYLAGAIHIRDCGALLEIEDPQGELRALFEMLDGSLDVDEIERRYRSLAPGAALDPRTAIGQLDEAGVLMNAADTTTLDEYELERYSRNIGFFETYSRLDYGKHAMQERLRDCRVALLGVGGVGSHLAPDLLGLGVQDLRIVDFDTLQLSNFNRQVLYAEADIGRNKVDRALERLRAYSSRARVAAVTRRLGSPDDVYEVVHDRDIVFACVDGPRQIVEWFNAGCVRAGVPFISGGVETQRALLYTVVPGVSGCVECWKRGAGRDEVSRTIMERMIQMHEDDPTSGQYAAAFGPLVTVDTGLMVTELVRLVTGIAPPLSVGRLIEARFDDLVPREAEVWERQPDCPVCAGVTPTHRLSLVPAAV